jgi:hypothetical protein
MSGSIPLLPLYAFMAWTGTALTTHWLLVINTYGSNFLLCRHFQGHACSCGLTTVSQLPVIVPGNVAPITWVLLTLSFGFREGP